MMHYLSPDIWLQQREDRTLACNVRTGRRALLNSQELDTLDSFAQGAEFQAADATHNRFLDADLIHTDEPVDSPRVTALTNVLDRHLLRDRGMRRKAIREQFPDDVAKLHELKKYLAGEVVQDSYLPNVLNRDLNAMLDHVESFLSGHREPFRFRPGFVKQTAGRPLPREDYEQQPCMPETSQRRVEMARGLLGPDSRALILGDDDLLSVYWSHFLSQECDVFELDQELIDFLTPRLSGHVSIKARDLTLGLPEEFHGLYDVVFTDPMYEESGMNLFMRCCSDALSGRSAGPGPVHHPA